MKALISTRRDGRDSDPFADLIRSVWVLSADFLISDEEVEARAAVWTKVLGEDFFVKYGNYTLYLIRQCCHHRTWRGPIHADEFYRMFCRVVFGKEVWSNREKCWISEVEAIELILNLSEEKASRYRVAEESGDLIAREFVIAECKAIIYGWEGEHEKVEKVQVGA